MTTAPDLALLTGTLLYSALFHHFYIATPSCSIPFKPSDVSHITTDGPVPVIAL